MSDSLWLHEMQHATLPCPSLSNKTPIFHLAFHLNEPVREEQLNSPHKSRRKGYNMTE